MKRIITILALAVMCTSVSAQTLKSKVIDEGGSGPYKAVAVWEATLPEYTIYRPENLKAAARKEGKLPVIVYGNGGCRNTSVEHERFLNELASHGYVIIAIGPYTTLSVAEAFSTIQGSTDASMLNDAIDWVMGDSQRKGSEYRKRLNLKAIATMGQSCGGLQALTASLDERVKTAVVLNSGIFKADGMAMPPMGGGFPGMGEGEADEGMKKFFEEMMKNAGENPGNGMPDFSKMFEGGVPGKGMGGTIGKSELVKLHVPLVYIVGGPSDIAYANAEDDFQLINHVPVAMANLPVGHLGTYSEPFGGKFSVIALKWLDWQLKGRKGESAFFLDDDYASAQYPEWTVVRKNF